MKRYDAKAINGLGYVFDREFSTTVPIAVESSYAFAQEQADKFNKEAENEEGEN